jgi:hypothetical protein
MVKSFLLYTHCLVIVKVKEMEKNIKCFFFFIYIYNFYVCGKIVLFFVIVEFVK